MRSERCADGRARESPARFIDIVRIGLPRMDVESILCRRWYPGVNPGCEPRGETSARERNINRGHQMLLRNVVAGRDFDRTPSRVRSPDDPDGTRLDPSRVAASPLKIDGRRGPPGFPISSQRIRRFVNT